MDELLTWYRCLGTHDGQVRSTRPGKHPTSFNNVYACACSHFGPVIFTRTLLPLLKRTAQEEDSDVRVVMVSAGDGGAVSTCGSRRYPVGIF